MDGSGKTHSFLWSLERSGERRHLVDGSAATAEHTELRPSMAIFLPDRLALVKGPPSLRRAHLDRLAQRFGRRGPSHGGAMDGRLPSGTRFSAGSGQGPRRLTRWRPGSGSWR